MIHAGKEVRVNFGSSVKNVMVAMMMVMMNSLKGGNMVSRGKEQIEESGDGGRSHSPFTADTVLLSVSSSRTRNDGAGRAPLRPTGISPSVFKVNSGSCLPWNGVTTLKLLM